HLRAAKCLEVAGICLARGSLGIILLMSVQGCIVADPPVFEEPERTPPFLDLAAADPPIFEILQQGPADQVRINVPFRSEDAGDRLQAVLFLNYQTPTQAP